MNTTESTTLRPGTEWLGGVARLRTYICNEGEPYRPYVIAWMDAATGKITGSIVVRPEDVEGMAAAHLAQTASAPRAGDPGMPARVRVATAELAAALRSALPEDVKVVCAPTPELDRAMEALVERIERNEGEPDLRYGPGGASPDRVGAMFQAAARFYRARVWDLVPDDQSPFGITSEPLGLRDALVSVIGQAGQIHGFLLFATLDDYRMFRDQADRARRGHEPRYPPHCALTFARRADVGRPLRREVFEGRWELAHDDAYPIATVFDEDGVGRLPTPTELRTLEAIAGAIAELAETFPSELEESSWEGAPRQFDKALVTGGDSTPITVIVPAPGTAGTEELADEPSDDGLDDARATQRRELLARFEHSPEAARDPEALQWAALLLDHAATYFGRSADDLTPPELRSVLFEIIPRKVSVAPEAAPSIVAGLRAWFRFVGRDLGGAHAGACLEVLDGDASQRLARRLADPSCYGPAKAFVMAGEAAGFDMSTRAGIDAWFDHARRHDLRFPPARPWFDDAESAARIDFAARRTAARSAKKKRKAQRAARKKNRSR